MSSIPDKLLEDDDVSSEEVEVVAVEAEAEEVTSFLDTCTSAELSTYLAEERFREEPAKIVSFLQAALQHAEKRMNHAREESKDQISSEFLAPLLATELETSISTPRMGKVKIQLAAAQDGDDNKGGLLASKLAVTNASQQQQLHLPRGSVSHLILFPKPEDCKLIRAGKGNKHKGHMVLLKLRTPIKFQGKETDQVCFSLPFDKKSGPTGPNLASLTKEEISEESGWQNATEAWCQVLAKGLSSTSSDQPMTVTRVQVDGTVFVSHMDMSTSTTTSGMPFVGCNRGVQDGVLYPLKHGLLFFKPPRFIPRSEMLDIVIHRRASTGQSSSRYMDVVVILKDETESNRQNIEEFTNILAQEEGPLKEYKETFLDEHLLGGAHVDGSDSDGDDDSANAEATDRDSDEDDENFVEGEESDAELEEEDESDDDGGIPIVNDDFAEQLLREKRKQGSITESETESESDISGAHRKPRQSKRLRSAMGIDIQN